MPGVCGFLTSAHAFPYRLHSKWNTLHSYASCQFFIWFRLSFKRITFTESNKSITKIYLNRETVLYTPKLTQVDKEIFWLVLQHKAERDPYTLWKYHSYHSALKGGGSLILDKTTPPTLTTAAAAAAFYNNENGRHFAYVFLITISLVAFSHFHYDSGLYTLSHSCSFLSLLLFFCSFPWGTLFLFDVFHSVSLARWSLLFESLVLLPPPLPFEKLATLFRDGTLRL